MPTTDTALIDYEWLSEYTEEYSSDPGSTPLVRARVQTDWDAVPMFPGAMMGTAGVAGNRELTRTAPASHPQKNWLHCTNCNLMNGIGAIRAGSSGPEFFDNPGGGEGKAAWDVTYSYLGYDLLSDEFTHGGADPSREIMRWIVKRSKPSMEALPIHGKAWKWTSDNTPISEPVTLLIPSTELTYTWMYCPYPLNEADWIDRLGDVNSASFDTKTAWANYAAQTVFFQGYEKEPILLPSLSPPYTKQCYHVTFTFLVHFTGWNKAVNIAAAGGPAFKAIEHVGGGGAGPYELSDLNLIFRGPPI